MNHPIFFQQKTRHATDMLTMNGQTFKDESTSKNLFDHSNDQSRCVTKRNKFINIKNASFNSML